MPSTPVKARHRGESRSSKAAKTITKTAAVTGVAVAVPMVALQAPADAATTSTWNRLAQCESGGNWKINTGNGYYGGLQFSARTWRAFGGGKYASYANKATKYQQIAIAEKVLDVQGWGAWPACSRKLGLGSSDKKGGGDRDRADKRTSREKQRTHKKSHKSKVHSKSRSSVKSAPKVRSTPSGPTYVIRLGDSLSKIAQSHNVKGGWQALWKLNRTTLGDNPNLIFPNQTLRLR